MARHGENIRKRTDGRWEGRYLKYSEEKGKRQYHSIYGRTYEEAKEKLMLQKSRQIGLAAGDDGNMELGNKCLVQSSFAQGSDAETGNLKVKETEDPLFSIMAQEWLMAVKMTKKPSTYVKYRLVYQNYLEKAFQGIKISMVTDSLVREKISDPLSESTGKSVYCVLNQVLKYASGKYPVTIPCLKLPVSHTPKKPVETFSKKEQAKLFSELYRETDPLKAAVLLCFHTGLRLGELCALKWEDLDGENQVITVNRTVQRLYVEGQQTKTALVETEPKSAHSKREIPLPSAALALLKQLQDGKAYIFGGDKPVDPRTMQNHFRKILEKAGVTYKNFHTLRHTFSTNCIEGGADVKSLSEILGHSDVKITLNRYVHPSMDTKRRYLDTLSVFYGQIHGQIHGREG